MDTKRFQAILHNLYTIVGEFETMFPGRPFTPDGHMVGSLGEALASYHYGLELLAPSKQTHDARKDGLLVQIKATQGTRVAFRSQPRHALVLKIHKDGSFEEVYNGPGDRIWPFFKGKRLPSNGQYQIGIARLRTLMNDVPDRERIPRIR